VLYRKGRGVEPTPAGAVLLRHAENLIGLAELAAREMSDFAEGTRGHVRLAANPSAIAQFLPDVLAAFMKDNPGIRIALNEAVSDVIVQQLRDGLVDAGIFSAAVDHAGIETFAYLSDRLCAIVPLGHPLSDRARVPFRDIVHYPHVALADGSSLFAQIAGVARELDAELDVAVSVRSFDGVRRMVARGLGVAVLPAGVTEAYAESDGLAVIELSDDWATRQFLIGVRERKALSRPAERFMAHMLDGA
jgi:DNA-binding transcriptional LysR family regulator